MFSESHSVPAEWLFFLSRPVAEIWMQGKHASITCTEEQSDVRYLSSFRH